MAIPTLQSYQEIARQYDDYNKSKDSGQSSYLGFWRNFFTGVLYRGAHSSDALRDWLAGGVKNNFLFGLLPKSDHANFIAVIDRACEIGNDALLLEEISKISDGKNFNDQIGELFLEYFENIKEKYNKNFTELNKEMLRKLKKDINNFLEPHKLTKRIQKNNSVLEEKNYYQVNNAAYQEKKYHRKIKTWKKRIARSLAFLAGIAEALINYKIIISVIITVLGTSSLVFPCALFFAMLGAAAGLNTGYNLFSDCIKEGLYEIRHGRFFGYAKLRPFYKCLFIALSGLSSAAGLCAAALASSSIAAIFGIAATLSVASIATFAVALPLGIALIFLFIRTIAKSIKHLQDSKSLRAYWEDTSVHQIARDILELVLAISLMAVICVVGFILYRDRVRDVATVWNLCDKSSIVIVSSLCSAINASVKLIFGTQKTHDLLFPSKIQTNSPEQPSLSVDPSRIQREKALAAKHHQSINNAAAVGNAIGKGALYANSAIHAGLDYTSEAVTSSALYLKSLSVYLAGIMVGIFEAIYMGAPALTMRSLGGYSIFSRQEVGASSQASVSPQRNAAI